MNNLHVLGTDSSCATRLLSQGIAQLVSRRARLDASDDPRRIFKVSVEAAAAAGLVGAKRVLDSTPLCDAVATMDTVTRIRSALRGLLRVADDGLEAELRAVVTSGDDYATAAKPQIDWDDPDAREALIDSRAGDAFACLALLDGSDLAPLRLGRPLNWWPRWWAKTWRRPTRAPSASLAVSPRTG